MRHWRHYGCWALPVATASRLRCVAGSDRRSAREAAAEAVPAFQLLSQSDMVAAGLRRRRRRLKVDDGVVGRWLVWLQRTCHDRRWIRRRARQIQIRVVDLHRRRRRRWKHFIQLYDLECQHLHTAAQVNNSRTFQRLNYVCHRQKIIDKKQYLSQGSQQQD